MKFFEFVSFEIVVFLRIRQCTEFVEKPIVLFHEQNSALLNQSTELESMLNLYTEHVAKDAGISTARKMMIDPCCPFHHHFKNSFYANFLLQKSKQQKVKKSSFNDFYTKKCLKIVGEIDKKLSNNCASFYFSPRGQKS